jgi:hypothetical protein
MPWAIIVILLASGLPVGLAASGLPTAPVPGAAHHAPALPPLATLTGGPRAPRAHAGAQVNPNAYYTSEPAPMGIADFGVDPATGAGYTYNTTQFDGTVTISSLSVLDYSNTGEIDQMSIQLNVVLVVSGSGGTFEYWIQDVAFLNTTSNLIQFIDNVWNMSSSGAYTTGTDITGNGTGFYGWYFDVASSALPGNDIYLTYPTSFQLRVVSSTTLAGVPSVAFEYNDTGTWETYDNILVAFAGGYNNQGFVVDGTTYNPFGLFNDAELILGGPGGGSQTSDHGSSLALTLDYWNGHNLQPVVNAYNFGSDTAEGIDHVVDRGRDWTTNGSLFGLVTNGTGRGLGTLYDHSFDSLVNVSSPLSAGLVLLNGTVVTSFVGNDANLTIAPGAYDLALETPGGSAYASEPIVVPAGAYVPIVFGVAGSYAVTFKETGLPAGTPWTVTVGANASHSSGTTIALLDRNGTYGFAVSPIAGYVASPWSGNFTVAGQTVTVPITWTRMTYPVTFTESGLPNGTSWKVTVGGIGQSASIANLSFAEPNGTFAYQVAGIAGYVPTPSAGSVNVVAGGASFRIVFATAQYDLTFTEHGLPASTTWSVIVLGLTDLSFLTTIVVPLPNGTYDYQLGLVRGYSADASSGSVQIAGAARGVEFNFSEYVTQVTFTESGLPAGTSWSVSVAGSSDAGTSSSLTLELVNGSYTATVADKAPYVLAVGNVTFGVTGSPVGVPVPFAPLPGWLSGTISPGDATVTVNGTTIMLSDGAFNITLAPGTYTIVVELSGYQTDSQVISIGPGSGASVSVNLAAVPPPTHLANGTQPIVVTPTGSSPSGWEIIALAAVAAAVAAVVLVVVARRRTPPPGEVDEETPTPPPDDPVE